jgi:coniferyl-aldehyde dehydrogenase
MTENAPAPAAVQAPFDVLRAASRAQLPPDRKARRTALKALYAWVKANTDAIDDALNTDFGGRSKHETRLAETLVVANGIKHTLKHLDEWMAPQPRSVYWPLEPARARIERQPLGVVGIIAPWNYPFHLAALPLVTAVAAGNRVLLKPSEITPATAALLERMCSEVFAADHVTTVQGGAEVGAAFAGLPFDHLFFTGSTAVGRKVLQAAAPNLTPVTLELGGKSPTVVHPSFKLDTAAARIAAAKLFSAGQTCVAPDYVMVPKGQEAAMATAFLAAAATLYPTLGDDYTAVINDRHFARLSALIEDARAKGATVQQHGTLPPGTTKLPPTVVTNVTPDMLLMQEEIFGPVLPIEGYDSVDAAIATINERPRPLALYYFDHSAKRGADVLKRTTSGGALLNDCLLHVANEDLPFGGVGPSGMGAYHGERGFLALSHEKSVMIQARLPMTALFRPPYGALVDTMVKLLT